MIAALLAEGTSDKALLPILRWVLACASPVSSRIEWIDTSSVQPRRATLLDKVKAAKTICQCDLLFVHRDSDKQSPELRYEEIRQAVGDQNHVAVVPIRMTEAWLLIDAESIRAASGKPSGVEDLGLPPLAKLEAEAEPKDTLYKVLKRAHGATGRRAHSFHPPTAAQRLADLIEDWTPLRRLSAFQRLEEDTRSALRALGHELHPARS